jgi:catechol 2,3-dioxygenase-like lactoylglutathione lyase family enzyme
VPLQAARQVTQSFGGGEAFDGLLWRLPMMHLEQIDHIALRCASPEATMAWYVRILGFEHVFPGQWSGVPIVLRLGPTYITLFPQKGNEQPSADGRAWHLALRAATYSDFRSAQAELQARGISFQFRDHEIAHSIYFFDPDDFLLEITTYDVPEEEKESKRAPLYGQPTQ